MELQQLVGRWPRWPWLWFADVLLQTIVNPKRRHDSFDCTKAIGEWPKPGRRIFFGNGRTQRHCPRRPNAESIEAANCVLVRIMTGLRRRCEGYTGWFWRHRVSRETTQHGAAQRGDAWAAGRSKKNIGSPAYSNSKKCSCRGRAFPECSWASSGRAIRTCQKAAGKISWAGFYLRWDISLICSVIVFKLAVTGFTNLDF